MSAPATNPTLSTEPTPAQPMTAGQRRSAKAGYARIKHGLYSGRAIIPGESQEAFQAFRHDMVMELLPGTPIESSYAEQLVMLQWKLRRLWAGQTGVHRRHDAEHPVAADAPDAFPERVAACIHADNAGTGDLHRMGLEEQRLINLFVKVQRKYEQCGELRRKRLQRGAKWDHVETEEYYPAREGHLDFRSIEPRLDSAGYPNPQQERPWAPPQEVAPPQEAASPQEVAPSPAPEAPADLPEAPAAVPEAVPVPPVMVPAPEFAESGATASNDRPSIEITDRRTARLVRHRVAGHPVAGHAVPGHLDPAQMTPYQREIEALEAEDDRWRDLIDRKAAAG